MALIFRATIPSLDLEAFEKKILERYADAVKSELVDRTPGKAAKAWKISGPESSTITISNDTKYLPFIERGTGIYGPFATRITPKTASVLAWVQNGKKIFATSTKGMPAQPFIKGAIRAGMEVAHGNL
jgi:hypothetical protein